MRAHFPHKSRSTASLALAGLALAIIGVVAAIGATPASAADADLACSATAQGDEIALAWTASAEAPTVHVRQVLVDGSTKWRLTTEATSAELPDFAFGIDAEYIVRYRLDDGVQDVPCDAGVNPPPPPPATAECIQVETGGADAYLTWEDFGGSRYAVRSGTVANSNWVTTVDGTSATVAAGNTYVVRSNGVDATCEVLLDLDDDPTFDCALLPRFTTQMQLTWTDDGDATHQIRSVNVAAFEDQFSRTGSNNLANVPVGPLYFIRRDTGDTPCLPVAADGSPLSPCVITDQPRSVDLTAADCAAISSLIDVDAFPANSNPCNTSGVFCNGRQVTQITLDLNGAPVPTAVGDLAGLRNLALLNATGLVPQTIDDADLYGLTLGGNLDLPDLSNLGRLTDLEFIGSVPANNVDTLSAKDVVVADLNGVIPTSLAGIDGMKRLTISANDTTTIPESLIVDTLRELRVSGSNVTGTLPELDGLHVLDLSDTAVSGTIPASYATSSLRELSLANTSVSGTLPNFGQTRRLAILDIGNADLTGAIPASLGDSDTLVSIDLRSNDLSGTIPGALANIETLRNLDLRKNDLTGTLPIEFGGLDPEFERLDLSGNQLSGTIPSTWMGLRGTPVFDGFSRFEIDLADNLLVGPLPTFSGSEIIFFDLRGNRLEGDITEAAAYGFDNDINFRWADGQGGNNCLSVTNAAVQSRLDAEQAGWDRCD